MSLFIHLVDVVAELLYSLYVFILKFDFKLVLYVMIVMKIIQCEKYIIMLKEN